jgi:hypothetical protein
MTTERQIQDKVSETQVDSLGIEQTQHLSSNNLNSNQKKTVNSKTKSATNSDPQDDLDHLEKLDLVTKNLQNRLNSIDASASS